MNARVLEFQENHHMLYEPLCLCDENKHVDFVRNPVFSKTCIKSYVLNPKQSRIFHKFILKIKCTLYKANYFLTFSKGKKCDWF